MRTKTSTITYFLKNRKLSRRVFSNFGEDLAKTRDNFTTSLWLGYFPSKWWHIYFFSFTQWFCSIDYSPVTVVTVAQYCISAIHVTKRDIHFVKVLTWTWIASRTSLLAFHTAVQPWLSICLTGTTVLLEQKCKFAKATVNEGYCYWLIVAWPVGDASTGLPPFIHGQWYPVYTALAL